ncbi:phage integrase family protein [Candidatus Desulforudis audaxviator MP104C]|uniref:Phage integrase family protein n=1 Tax=Desulforudis audaxviator (strain MP104C) TaxID=477974 RepID=B1I2S8_DESAP|nr:tyrosine-type recombinase/integrase [Candidatus Desulforudis audaxviator]ACA59297.1 phage integrase family protein [Candidatus Desulforudis audaxviator MP104C]
MHAGTLNDFQNHLLGRGLAPATAGVYLGHVRRFLAWVEGTHGEADVAAVTSLDVADYRRHLLKDRKPATVNNALDALSSFFAWAKDAGLVQADPTDGVRRAQEERGAPRWLTRREVGALVRAVQKHGSKRDQALVTLLLHTGLRVSEAVGLKTQDAVIRERSGHVIVRRGKGEKYREVPLNVTARKALQDWLAAHPGGPWLFPGRGEAPLTRWAAEKMFAKLGRLAGVEVTPHKLRHTFCKMLVDAGESLDRVAVLAGHANLNTTARYTRPGVQDLERAVEKLAWE